MTKGTLVEVELSDETLRALDELSVLKGITRTEALEEAVSVFRRIYNFAPDGAAIRPLGPRTARLFGKLT